MRKRRVGIYAGSFDPLTNGHIDIIQQAAELFDNVFVLVAVNPHKKTLFSMEERLAMIREALDELGFSNVEADSWQGAVVDYAHRQGAKFLIRGLRTVSDFEFELMMAQVNANVEPSAKTVFLPASQEMGLVSSSGVREAALAKKIVRGAVPKSVERRLREKLNF